MDSLGKIVELFSKGFFKVSTLVITVLQIFCHIWRKNEYFILFFCTLIDFNLHFSLLKLLLSYNDNISQLSLFFNITLFYIN